MLFWMLMTTIKAISSGSLNTRGRSGYTPKDWGLWVIPTHRQASSKSSISMVSFSWNLRVEAKLPTWELKQSFQLAQFMRDVGPNDRWWYSTTQIRFRHCLFSIKINNDICHMYEPWREAMHYVQTVVELLGTDSITVLCTFLTHKSFLP